MGDRIRKWFLLGAGAGWAASLLFLGWTLPHHVRFVDSLLWGLALLVLAPAVAGGVLALFPGTLLALATRHRQVQASGTWRWLGRISLSLGALVILLTVASALAPPRRLHTRMLLYGVDGATWSVIDALRPLEMLPEFERLRAEGASGILRSLEPMLSPIVWTTIGSGVGLDRHGIAGFHVTHDACRSARFWDVLEDRGMVVGTYKWLVTYPPREIEGFMVPGWLATGPEVEPEDLTFARVFEQSRKARFRAGGEAPDPAAEEAVGPVRYVAEGVRHGLRLTTLVELARFTLENRISEPSGEERMVRIQVLRARIDRDLFIGLLERYDPDVATFTYYPTDAVAHRMWKYYDPDPFGGATAESQRFWNAVPSTYRQADEILGELRARLPDDAMLVVLSDHGMTAAGTEGGVAVFGLRAGEVDAALAAAGASVDVSQVGMKVTVAVAQGSTRPPEEVEELLEAFQIGGRDLFRVETLSPGVFGLTLALEGDVRDRSAEAVTLPDGSTVPFESFLRMRDDYSGVHHEDGVILLAGPGVGAGASIEGADLYDVAPTVLTSLGVPPSEEMEGRVLREAFDNLEELTPTTESYSDLIAGFRFPVTADDDGGDAALEERLRALGYVDTPREEP